MRKSISQTDPHHFWTAGLFPHFRRAFLGTRLAPIGGEKDGGLLCEAPEAEAVAPESGEWGARGSRLEQMSVFWKKQAAPREKISEYKRDGIFHFRLCTMQNCKGLALKACH